MTLSLKESFIRHAAYLEGSRSEKRDVCVARESKRCSEASARSVTGGDSKWIAVQPQRPLLGRLCNKRGPGSLSASRFVYDICLASPGAYTSERPGGLDIRIWRSFQSSGDVGVTGGGVGGFKGGILAADRYVGFGAGGSDTGTGCN